MTNKAFKVRTATISDLNDIVNIDKEIYGAISDKVTSSESIMKERINISSSWFFVVEFEGRVVGFLSLQPTDKPFRNFKNWEDSTDNGTLKKTYKENGEYVYGVALTISKKNRGQGLSDLLFQEAGKKMIKENKKYVYFSGRLPGYHKFSKKMSAQEYYKAKIHKNGKLVSIDPQIRMYESYGLKKVRLVKQGFGGDKESCNYSVVFMAKNPFYGFPFSAIWANLFAILISNKYLARTLLK